MKVFVLIENPYEKHQNPYVKTLIDGINAQYDDVEWGYGLSTFWNDEIYEYDIIHIHWPNVFIWDKRYISNAINFEQRIKEIKNKGVKIISTCHNLEPHYSTNPLEFQLYKITYKYSDCIIHLGNYSLNLFKEKYPKVKHVLLLHHIYDTIYTQIPTRKESIEALKLNPNENYILCFGAFRSNEERALVIQLSKYLSKKDVKILAPSFLRIPKRRNKFYVVKALLQYYYYKIKYPNIITTKYFVDDNKLLYYYGVSSVSLIQRVKILNSGNVSLGFQMGNVVVGPNIGNVGTWLNETKNYTFESNKIDTLFYAIESALKDGKRGMENQQYAYDYLSIKNISSNLYCYYKGII